MRMFNGVNGYATEANAMRKLVNAAEQLGVSIEEINYVIVVNPNGRFVPVVTHARSEMAGGIVAFVHLGVPVLGN